MKYIDAERLRAEIEKKRYEVVSEALNPDASMESVASAKYKKDALSDVISLINSLQQEQPEGDLEKDAVSYCYDNGINISPQQAKGIARHFFELGLNARKKK